MYKSVLLLLDSMPGQSDEESAAAPDVSGFHTPLSVSCNGWACQISSDGEITVQLAAGFASDGNNSRTRADGYQNLIFTLMLVARQLFIVE